METTFSWKQPAYVDGHWYISPMGDLCKALKDDSGGVIAIRRGPSGIWRGSQDEFTKLFKPVDTGSTSVLI